MCQERMAASSRDSIHYQALPEEILAACNQVTDFCRLYRHLLIDTEVFSKENPFHSLWKTMMQPYSSTKGVQDPYLHVRPWVSAMRQSGMLAETDAFLPNRAAEELYRGTTVNELAKADLDKDTVAKIIGLLPEWQTKIRPRITKVFEDKVFDYIDAECTKFLASQAANITATPDFGWELYKPQLELWCREAAELTHAHLHGKSKELVSKMNKSTEAGEAAYAIGKLQFLADRAEVPDTEINSPYYEVPSLCSRLSIGVPAHQVEDVMRMAGCVAAKLEKNIIAKIDTNWPPSGIGPEVEGIERLSALAPHARAQATLVSYSSFQQPVTAAAQLQETLEVYALKPSKHFAAKIVELASKIVDITLWEKDTETETLNFAQDFCLSLKANWLSTKATTIEEIQKKWCNESTAIFQATLRSNEKIQGGGPNGARWSEALENKSTPSQILKHSQKTQLLDESSSKRGLIERELGKAVEAYKAAMVVWRTTDDQDLLEEASAIIRISQATTYEAHVVRNLQKEKSEWQAAIRKYKSKFEADVQESDIHPAVLAVIKKYG